MAIKIGSNISSLQAQRRLGEATSSLSTIYERLSSGQRINKASDDAAGLAIADDLKAKERIFTQAIRNGNDGISLLNIADSAIENLAGIVTRIRELAEQSANGSYSNTQRKAIDTEAQALSQEYTRIKTSTSFNGIKIFDGTLGNGLRLQLGLGTEGSIKASVGGVVGTGTFASSSSYSTESYFSNALVLGDLNNDGILDMLSVGRDDLGYGYGGTGLATVRLGTGNGSFGAARSFELESDNSYAVALGDLNGDGILDLVSAGYGGYSSYTGGYATVRLGTGTGSFASAISYVTEAGGSKAVALKDLDGDGILDLITAGYASGGLATVRLGTGSGTFGAASTYLTEGSFTDALTLEDLNGDGILDLVTSGQSGSMGYATIRLGTGKGSFANAISYSMEAYRSNAVSLGDLNGDGILDLVTAGQSGTDGSATIRLGSGNGLFGTATSYSMNDYGSNAVSLGDLNGDGILDLITAGEGNGGSTRVRLGKGNGTFGTAISYLTESSKSAAVALGDLNGDDILDVVSAGYGGSAGYATVRLGNSQDGISALLKFSLKTRADALLAMTPLQRVQDNLAKQRGVIGANQSRIGIAINNLINSKENFAAAESRIRDTDIAADSASLIRTQILQQAATSVLAQANQAPQLALILLR